MARRLNIEICNNTKTLANADYNRSAYTGKALRLTEKIIKAYFEKRKDGINDLALTVKLFGATGTGINRIEQDRILQNSKSFLGIAFRNAIGSEHGLLAVTKEGIAETRNWADEHGTVIINIEEETFSFNIFFENNRDSFIKNRINKHGCGKVIKTLKNINIFDEIPFSKIGQLIQMIQDNPYGILIDDNTIISWVG